LPIEGEWEIRACWKGNERYQGVVSQPLKLYPGLKAGRILIVAGGGKENNNLWEPIEYLTKQFYSMLINRQCTHDMICYISPDTSNTNESIIIDDSSPEVNDIKNYIQQLYIGKPLPDVDKDRPFLIYLADHGEPGKFQVNQGNEILDAKDLDEWLDKLQYETNCPVHIIIESC
jgi:hypothetical protein